MNDHRIETEVKQSLEEDIGSGDITAALIDPSIVADAEVVTREPAVVCGIPWFNEVYRQVDPDVRLEWKVAEGDAVKENEVLVTLGGNARSLVTAERCALNWLQFLSGISTKVSDGVSFLSPFKTELLDTRKTIPGLRYAQKYAVKIGGGRNHRMGLYDAYLIKENHIASCGSIKNAIDQARESFPAKPIEVEVEQMAELEEALSAGVDIVLLDNFDLDGMREAVAMSQGRAKLEVSGNVDIENLYQIAETGVDFISMGALTKNVKAIDLSMRFISSL